MPEPHIHIEEQRDDGDSRFHIWLDPDNAVARDGLVLGCGETIVDAVVDALVSLALAREQLKNMLLVHTQTAESESHG